MHTTNTGIRLRPITDLDFKLYEEIARPATEWANNHLTPEMIEHGPPEELCQLARVAQEKMRHLGFVMTARGMMIRDEPDILQDSSDQLIAEGKRVADEQLARIMKM